MTTCAVTLRLHLMATNSRQYRQWAAEARRIARQLQDTAQEYEAVAADLEADAVEIRHPSLCCKIGAANPQHAIATRAADGPVRSPLS
jgi:hypothetical protein